MKRQLEQLKDSGQIDAYVDHGTILMSQEQEHKQLEKWNSQIKYESEVNKGTKVLIFFDECSENPLFPCEILLNEHSTVVVLDDDPSVHESWKQRFSIFKDKNINLN